MISDCGERILDIHDERDRCGYWDYKYARLCFGIVNKSTIDFHFIKASIL
jgi:hypothetical protein